MPYAPWVKHPNPRTLRVKVLKVAEIRPLYKARESSAQISLMGKEACSERGTGKTVLRQGCPSAQCQKCKLQGRTENNSAQEGGTKPPRLRIPTEGQGRLSAENAI